MKQTPAHRLGQDMIDTKEISVLLPGPERIGGVKDHRAAWEHAPALFDGPNGLDSRQVHVDQAGVNGGRHEAQIVATDAGLFNHAIRAGVQGRPDGPGQGVVWGDDKQRSHAANSSRRPAGMAAGVCP